MIITRSWLQDYIEIPFSDEELVDKLTFSGSLVDSYYKTLDDKIVIAQITEILPHPNADKLHLVKVSDGQTVTDVVCGAPNIETGQIVPLAKIGARVADFTIAEATIRGQQSNGMLCSEHELGLGEDHSGILILPADAKIGQPLSSIYGSELVMDLEITPNRGDCMSHIGIAREVAVLLNKSISKEPVSLKMSGANTNSYLNVEVKNKDLCPRYLARVIQGVKIGPSPAWMQERLKLCGVNPINNIVDATNYIMLDLGQPLHAFDASCIQDHKIIVRKASKGESIVTLDGNTKDLDSSNLLIADSEKPIAIAGVMGGNDSQITGQTKDVVIEAAEFDAISIRKTAKSLGLSTDASYRFERGIDPRITEYAINKAVDLIQKIAGGNILQGIVRAESSVEPGYVSYQSSDINTLLGTNISDGEIARILKLLGFKSGEHGLEIPSWRHDITIWQDLAEEVARFYGLDNIKPVSITKSEPPRKSAYYYKEHIKDVLADLGFCEVYNYSFMSDQQVSSAKIDKRELLEVANPISPENKYMRSSLIPGILSSVAKNPTFDPVLIFEIGNVFTKNSEATHLCVAASGSRADIIINSAREKLSKIIKNADRNIIVKNYKREELSAYKVKKPFVTILELDLGEIDKKMKVEPNDLKLKTSKKKIHYRTVSKYPSVTRDLAFIIDKKINADEAISEIYGVSELINNVELFDEFASEKFGHGKKNMAFHVYLQAPDRTLNDDEADRIIKDIVKKIEHDFKAKLRDK